MTNRAALRWLIKGKSRFPVIQYMLLNDKLEYLIPPQEIIITELKKDVWTILHELEQKSNGNSLEIYFKSVTLAYGRHRRDSAQFHYLISSYLRKNNLIKSNSRTAYLLKKEDLRLFKSALNWLDVDCKTRGCAYVAYLWMIALKATRSRIKLVIKQIWMKRLSIIRMNKKQRMEFSEFYSLLDSSNFN